MPSYTELTTLQAEIEKAFSRKGIKKAVLEYMQTIPECEPVILQGIEHLKNWCALPAEYESKQTRKDHISQMDLRELVTDVFVAVASLTSETTLNNLASSLAPMVGFDDTRAGIQAMGEVIAVLCDTNFYDLVKYHVNSSIYIKSNFTLPDNILEYIGRACYLPPMLVKPMTLKNNRSSGYLTVKGDSLILGGSYNHHNNPIALDVLNIMNRYRLTLNEWVLNNIVEEPTSDLDEVANAHELTDIEIMKQRDQQHKNWKKHVEQSKYFYELVLTYGNKMYLTNKFDKRGRIYTQGYHISNQGTSYKKAVCELYDKEHVEVPNGFFN